MTERKPPRVSWESWIDGQIRTAQERGEFDNLPGKGRPIADLDDPHDELWWIKRLLKREEISVLPPALALRKDVDDALDQLANLRSEKSVRDIVTELNRRIREMNAKPAPGPPTTLMPLDVDAIVVRWRAARAASAS